jgi:hypothetical protein
VLQKESNGGKKKKLETQVAASYSKGSLATLEVAQEHTLLTDQELDLCRRLKARSMGLAVIEKARIRQRSRLTYI